MANVVTKHRWWHWPFEKWNHWDGGRYLKCCLCGHTLYSIWNGRQPGMFG